MKTPLTAAEQGGLMRRISDLESGSARQWYWLEIAQNYPHDAASKKEKILGIALQVFGINACQAILQRLGLTGLALYQAASDAFWRLLQHKTNDAILIIGGVLALLIGFNRLPASQQLAAWCLAIGGAIWQIIRIYRSPAPAPSSEALGAEDSLGLQGLLITAGVTPTVSSALIKGLIQAPQQFLAPLLINLPDLAPATEPSRAQQYACSALPWLVIGTSSSAIIGALPPVWGGICVLLLLLIVAWCMHRAVKPLALLALSWLSCGLLAQLTHWI
ncbi:hypothetical protein [Deefgea piscis]|uniref:hypothetical protein n=1 Tax=Deefgea piscis TaxID=2739061 RepID=UPI001C7F626F|nr:hypothetical protein [Deefgea piscis]QZA82227.1 hypothetical protein K4H25_06180 [Deefgea piscis]